MVRRLKQQLIGRLPEPVLRSVVRMRHGETPAQRRARTVPRLLTHRPARSSAPVDPTLIPAGVRPAVVTRFDAQQVRAATADLVRAALERHAVPFVAFPVARGDVARIAVDRDHRVAALRALARDLTGPEWAIGPRVVASKGRSLRRTRRLVGAAVHGARLYRVLVAPSGELLGTAEFGCDVEVWDVATPGYLHRSGGEGRGTRPRVDLAPVVPVDHLSSSTWAAAVASAAHWASDRPVPSVFEVREPVDIVYTWVDGSDPLWLMRKAAFSGHPALAQLNSSAVDESRFTSRDELKYSLRSVAMYASWVRKIFIVTDGQIPGWLDTSHPQVAVVSHKEIFSDPSVLPVFNSHAIESQLHHIPDLAEQYLYLNDDFFFGRPVEPELFFHGNGIAKFFLSPQTVDISPPSNRDLPVMSAAKRNRALIERRFGVTVTQKLKHTPHPQLRSVLEQMERENPDTFAQVAQSRFRHPDDVSIASSLTHHYAYALGRAVPGRIEYRYQDITLPDTRRRLDRLIRAREFDVFCLNDNESTPEQLREQRVMLAEFFERYYPVASPFELPEPETRS